MSGRVLLTSAQVALRLSRSLGWFRSNRDRLEARGFPRPIDGCGMRWDPVAIDAWLDRQRGQAADPAAAAEEELIRRAQAMAGPPLDVAA